MRVGERSTFTMTQLSVKIGRFAPGPGVGDAKVFGGRFGCDVDDDVSDDRREEEEDDVTLPSRTRSSSDLRSYFSISRKFSLPDFQLRGFQCADPDLDPPEVEMMMMEGEGEGEHGGDPSGMPWMDFYNRTPRAYEEEDDRILDVLNGVVRLQRDAESCDGNDGAEESSGTPGVVPPLPWRTEEALLALEDGSKYLREEEGSELFNADEATPQIRINESGGPHHHHHDLHPLASFNQSSSSRSGSFRKIPSFDSVPRPDLSACHSFSVSHWLSEAESRHSEPFCLPHHHLDPSSSGAGHRAAPPPLQGGHGLQRVCCQGNRLHSGSSSASSSSSSSEASFIPDDGEELGQPGHRDQVLKWLLANDLEATAVLDESDDHHSLEETSGQSDI